MLIAIHRQEADVKALSKKVFLICPYPQASFKTLKAQYSLQIPPLSLKLVSSYRHSDMCSIRYLQGQTSMALDICYTYYPASQSLLSYA